MSALPQLRPSPDRASRWIVTATPDTPAAPHPEAGAPTRSVTAQAQQQELPEWCWVGAHGGAGTSTLHQVSGVGHDFGRIWPSPPARVLLVARTHAHGLQCARRQLGRRGAAAVWALVLVADAPRRPPRELRAQIRILGGTVPRLWSIPWEEAWRVGIEHTSVRTTQLLRDLGTGD